MSSMPDRDTITLPREVVKLALEAFEAVMPFSTTQRELKIRAVEALRTHLAAPKQEQEHVRCNPADYCAAQFMKLYTAPPNVEALRRDAERYKWLRGMIYDDRIIVEADRMLYGAELDAAIDAAMGEKR